MQTRRFFQFLRNASPMGDFMELESGLACSASVR